MASRRVSKPDGWNVGPRLDRDLAWYMGGLIVIGGVVGAAIGAGVAALWDRWHR